MIRSSVVWGSEQDPAAAMAALTDALKLAFAVTLALCSPPRNVQLPSSLSPAERETSCSIEAPALPTQEMRERCAARARAALTGAATRFMEPSGTACCSVAGTVETTVPLFVRSTSVTRPRKPSGVSGPCPMTMMLPFCASLPPA